MFVEPGPGPAVGWTRDGLRTVDHFSPLIKGGALPSPDLYRPVRSNARVPSENGLLWQSALAYQMAALIKSQEAPYCNVKCVVIG